MDHVAIYNTVSLDGYLDDAVRSCGGIAEDDALDPFLAACNAADAVAIEWNASMRRRLRATVPRRPLKTRPR